MSISITPFPPPIPSTSSSQLDRARPGADQASTASTAPSSRTSGRRPGTADSDTARTDKWKSLFFNGQSPIPRGLGMQGPTFASGTGTGSPHPGGGNEFGLGLGLGGGSQADGVDSRMSTLLSTPSTIFSSRPRPPDSADRQHQFNSLGRTSSNQSAASTAASSDFLPTPKTPANHDRAWNSVGANHKKGKGPAMVDPRFAFPKGGFRRAANGPVVVNELGRLGGDEGGAKDSFVASL